MRDDGQCRALEDRDRKFAARDPALGDHDRVEGRRGAPGRRHVGGVPDPAHADARALRRGLHASGKPSSATARSQSAAPFELDPSRCRRRPRPARAAWCGACPCRAQNASTPLPVYGSPSHSSAPCTAPSSPTRTVQCNPDPLEARRHEFGQRRAPQDRMRAAFTPRETSASSTALPVISEISRSAEAPPIRTATWPNAAASLIRRKATPLARSRLTQSLPVRCTTGARGIRRGFSLANSAGTYEFARENPATSRAPAATPPIVRCAWPGSRERARKFRRRERAGIPAAKPAPDRPC